MASKNQSDLCALMTISSTGLHKNTRIQDMTQPIYQLCFCNYLLATNDKEVIPFQNQLNSIIQQQNTAPLFFIWSWVLRRQHSRIGMLLARWTHFISPVLFFWRGSILGDPSNSKSQNNNNTYCQAKKRTDASTIHLDSLSAGLFFSCCPQQLKMVEIL